MPPGAHRKKPFPTVPLWLLAGLIAAFCFVATSPYHAGLNNPNEMVRVYMSRSIAHHQTLSIDPVLKQWGPVDDKATRQGRMYSSKAPLHSLIGVPAAWILAKWEAARGAPLAKRTYTHVLRYLGGALWAAFAALGLFFALRRIEPARANLVLPFLLAILLGTMIYPYALTFTGHIWTALLVAAVAIDCAPRFIPGAPSRAWTGPRLARIGCAGTAAVFAEYPAALAVGPLILGALLAPGSDRRRRILPVALGAAPPLALGLATHWAAWGAPWRTGYSFLENRAYVKVHASGFFGIAWPKPDVLLQVLFSPDTGLFFFSPVLLIGVYGLFHMLRRRGAERIFAVSAALAVLLKLAFISGHSGWRGGWTLGPRYIIAIVPILGLTGALFLLSTDRVSKRLRFCTATTSGLSILATGFAAAIYPHLSDVFANPLATFVAPSYVAGFHSYGIAHSLSLRAANLPHVAALSAALVLTACPFLHVPRAHRWMAAVGLTWVIGAFAVAVIPEAHPDAAAKERARLWGFWEPALASPDWPEAPSVWQLRAHWRDAEVSVNGPALGPRRCAPRADHCVYGDRPWQRFGPEVLQVRGRHTPTLQIHPVAGARLVLRLPVPADASGFALRAALTDAATRSANHSPVKLACRSGLHEAIDWSLGNTPGFQTGQASLSPKAEWVVCTLETQNDGQRVVAIDAAFTRD